MRYWILGAVPLLVVLAIAESGWAEQQKEKDRFAADANYRRQHAREIFQIADAILRGDPSSAERLRALCRPEPMVPRSPKAVAIWCWKAAEHGRHSGRIDAYSALGFAYINGRGFERNVELGLHFLEIAARDPYEDATRRELILYYLKGRSGVKPNPKRVLYWLTVGAQYGYQNDAWYLAEYYSKGLHGFPHDRVEALKWAIIGKELSEVEHAGGMFYSGLTKAQVAEGERRAREFLAKYWKPIAR